MDFLNILSSQNDCDAIGYLIGTAFKNRKLDVQRVASLICSSKSVLDTHYNKDGLFRCFDGEEEEEEKRERRRWRRW